MYSPLKYAVNLNIDISVYNSFVAMQCNAMQQKKNWL